MTDAQFDVLLAVLERIADALEPKSVQRPLPDVPGGGGRRMKLDRFVTDKVEELVKSTALKPKQQ